jgi:hypothetical protein
LTLPINKLSLCELYELKLSDRDHLRLQYEHDTKAIP